MPERFIRPSVQEDYPYVLPDRPTRPIDEATGLPYCFFPNADLPPVIWPAPNPERVADWDHHFPKVETKYTANPVLLDDEANLALMNLRVQWTTFHDHHDVWNHAPYIGPLQPADKKQLAATLLFGLGNYIPPIGLDLSAGSPREARLSAEQRRHLWKSGQVRVADESLAIRYLQKYTLAQEVDHINESELEEFLRTPDPKRKLYLGHCLAAKVIERAVEPFDATYVKARKLGLLSVRSSRDGTVQQAPLNPRDLLKEKIMGGRRSGPVMSALAHRLAVHYKAQALGV